jgi:hypothetical protein
MDLLFIHPMFFQVVHPNLSLKVHAGCKQPFFGRAKNWMIFFPHNFNDFLKL